MIREKDFTAAAKPATVKNAYITSEYCNAINAISTIKNARDMGYWISEYMDNYDGMDTAFTPAEIADGLAASINAAANYKRLPAGLDIAVIFAGNAINELMRAEEVEMPAINQNANNAKTADIIEKLLTTPAENEDTATTEETTMTYADETIANYDGSTTAYQTIVYAAEQLNDELFTIWYDAAVEEGTMLAADNTDDAVKAAIDLAIAMDGTDGVDEFYDEFHNGVGGMREEFLDMETETVNAFFSGDRKLWEAANATKNPTAAEVEITETYANCCVMSGEGDDIDGLTLFTGDRDDHKGFLVFDQTVTADESFLTRVFNTDLYDLNELNALERAIYDEGMEEFNDDADEMDDDYDREREAAINDAIRYSDQKDLKFGLYDYTWYAIDNYNWSQQN